MQSEMVHGAGYRVETFGEGIDMGAPPSMPPIEDLESLGRWMAGGLGQGLGSIGAPIGAGLVGAGAGLAATGGNPIGAAVGAWGTSMGVNDMILAGEAVKQFEQSGVDPLLSAQTAHSIAPFMAALDTLSVFKVLQGPKRAKTALFKYIGQRLAHGATVESATEMAQGVIREFTDAELSGDPKVAERALSILEEGAIAAMTGGVVSGAASPFTSKDRGGDQDPSRNRNPNPSQNQNQNQNPRNYRKKK